MEAGLIVATASLLEQRKAAAAREHVLAGVERFDRRGTEPFEPFEPFEFFQNRNFPEFSLENSKISENFNIF